MSYQDTKHPDYKIRTEAAYPDFQFISTDSGDRALDSECGMLFQVERISYGEALAKYNPEVVLVSWMELGKDWTASIRACASVEQYILVGEADSGVCGRLWETWGVQLGGGAGSQPPSYEQDGFSRETLRLPQIGRTDDPWSRRARSSTVVFRRRRPTTQAPLKPPT